MTSTRAIRTIGVAACAAAIALACSSDDEESPSDGPSTGGTSGYRGYGAAPTGGYSGGAGSGGASTGGVGGFSGGGGVPGSDPNDLYACTGAGQCVLVDATRDCCVERCGDIDVDWYASIHAEHLSDWHAGQACVGCPAYGCDEATQREFVRKSAQFIATCDTNVNKCRPMDLAANDEITACTQDSDCRLRFGAACCEDRVSAIVEDGRDLDGLVAISNLRALQDLVCQNRFVGCGVSPDPPPEDRAIAVCGASGHCEVVRFDLPDPPDAGGQDASGGTPDAAGGGADATAAPVDGGADGS